MGQLEIGLIGIIGKPSGEAYWASMERVAAVGYRGIEGAETLLEGDAAANLERFQGLGLQALTVSAGKDDLEHNIDGLVAKARALQASRVSLWWTACESREAVVADAQLLQRAGKALAQHGIRLTYHHHDHEFRKVFGGIRAWDIFVGETDPEHVSFYVDIMWATFGGQNPAELIRRLGPRVAALHVKDVANPGPGEPVFTAVGTGIVPIRECLEAALEVGVPWAIVEQDRLRNLDAWETITLSYLYLKELGFA